MLLSPRQQNVAPASNAHAAATRTDWLYMHTDTQHTDDPDIDTNRAVSARLDCPFKGGIWGVKSA